MNKIKFGLVPPMPGADSQGLIEFCIKADQMGFDSLWFPDHLAFIAPAQLMKHGQSQHQLHS